MIIGLEVFKEFFRDFQNQYVLIGGAACDIVFGEADLGFRITRDFDMVLIIEALTPEFGQRFWDFVDKGGYENRVKSNGVPQFYRFDKPKTSGFPFMIELFTRSESAFDDHSHGCRPLHLGDEISSLSAILLNNDYYQLLQTGKIILSDVTVLQHTFLVLFKAKAWLDLTERKAAGQQIDKKIIQKHKNDVARLATLFTGNETCMVPASVLADMTSFIKAFEKEPPDMKDLGFPGVTSNDIADILKRIYIGNPS
ncbi:MAG: hypothetical protein FWF85_03610 [Clostridiales bacterium]|nr:hypothetical protein [Clostridiales bacterium]